MTHNVGHAAFWQTLILRSHNVCKIRFTQKQKRGPWFSDFLCSKYGLRLMLCSKRWRQPIYFVIDKKRRRYPPSYGRTRSPHDNRISEKLAKQVVELQQECRLLESHNTLNTVFYPYCGLNGSKLEWYRMH